MAMKEITKRIWNRGLNLTKWAKLNGFKLRTVRAVLDATRGSEDVGVSKKIKDTLVAQGFAVPEDFSQESGK